MSLQTWLEEFMPVDPKVAAEESELAAVEHSLRKWRGAHKENASRHDLFFSCCELYEDHDLGEANSQIWFNAGNCALCLRNGYVEDETPANCDICPIYKANGIECNETYSELDKNPQPMITLLELTADWVRKQQGA